MHYQNYQLDDFLRDGDFIQWVKNPTDEQRRFWELWLTEHPEKAHTVLLAKEIIRSVNYKHTYEPSEADLMEVWGRIQDGTPSVESGKIIRFPGLYSSFFRVAATLIFVLMASVLVWRYSVRDKSIKVSGKQPIATLIQKQTLRGQRQKIHLPDGSLLILNAESSIRYSSDFGKKNRLITLIGEAFFDVAHDTSRPFTIMTGNVKTTVVGTSFNINAYAEKPEITVAVLTGKVKVMATTENSKPDQLLLLPSDQYAYTKSDSKFHKQQGNLSDLLAWKDNVIVLKNANFQEIKRTLERWYAVNFIVSKGLKVKEDFSARFHNASLKSVLDALNYTSNFQYELVDRTVYVTPKKHD